MAGAADNGWVAGIINNTDTCSDDADFYIIAPQRGKLLSEEIRAVIDNWDVSGNDVWASDDEAIEVVDDINNTRAD